jgi:hypothetical protein
MNIWKISTLVLAGALALVVGRGAVQESAACDDNEQTAAEVTQIRLARALSFLKRAEQEVRSAPAAPPRLQRAMIQQITLAKAQVTQGLEPEEPMMAPRPRPRDKVVSF